MQKIIFLLLYKIHTSEIQIRGYNICAVVIMSELLRKTVSETSAQNSKCTQQVQKQLAIPGKIP